MTTVPTEDTHEAVRNHYGEVARTNGNCGCGPGCCSSGAARSQDLGYRAEDLKLLPEGADMGLGCGTPLAFANLGAGETVLDLGSGGGIDCFLAASQVGATGHVIGIDMTAAMVEKARANAAKVSAVNVDFRLSEIEHLPVADRSIDVIVSNCVINLSPDKPAVFREAFRVLKPGGRIAISDIVTSSPLPEPIRTDRTALVGCIAGAPAIDELRSRLVAAGFPDVVIDVNESSRSCLTAW